MTNINTVNKEEEISSSLSAILVGLVAAIDRLSLAVEVRNENHDSSHESHPLAYGRPSQIMQEPSPTSALPQPPPTGTQGVQFPVSSVESATEVGSAVSPTIIPATPAVTVTVPPVPVTQGSLATAASTFSPPGVEPTTNEVNSLPGPSLPNASNPAASSAPNGLAHILTPDEVRAQYNNTPTTISRTWFIVTRGLQPGVYTSWMETSPLVTGVSHAVYCKRSSKEEALSAYGSAWANGHVTRL
ncbi:hypothetical protein F5887DRAFT_1077031 [Amanita rubescens]|nr:hypothetical protein F5887DRAFT_1077031 [Amanita rubescens]